MRFRIQNTLLFYPLMGQMFLLQSFVICIKHIAVEVCKYQDRVLNTCVLILMSHLCMHMYEKVKFTEPKSIRDEE